MKPKPPKCLTAEEVPTGEFIYGSGVTTTREIDGVSVVLVGSFNPAIFQPGWLARHELVAVDEADAPDVQIVSREVTQFSTELFDIQVTHNQFVATTARVPSFGMLLDLVVGIFERLATWSPGGRLDWWVKERQQWLGQVRGKDGRQRWIRAVDLRPASGSQPGFD
jgi:hypothetical protein